MRAVSIVLVAALTAILILLLALTCLPIGQVTVPAVDGVLDLRDQAPGSQLFVLSGQWEFYYGALLAPSAFDRSAATDLLSVPSSWDTADYPRGGSATYRLQIYTADTRPMMLLVPEISGSAYAVWANGVLLRDAGYVHGTPSETTPVIENTLLSLQAEDGVIDLVVQVRNDHFLYSGMTGSILLGEQESLLRHFVRTRALSSAVLGSIFITALYHLALYLFRRRETVYLFFSLVCFVTCLRFLVETDGLITYLGWIPNGMVSMRLYDLFLFLHGAAIVLFSAYIFRRTLLMNIRFPAALYVMAGVVFSLFFPVNASYTFAVNAVLIAVPLAVMIALTATSPVLRSEPWSRLYFVALLLYMGLGLTLNGFFLQGTVYMVGLLGNTFLILSQSLILARDYAGAFRLVEDTNRNLEGIVTERTRDLVATNQVMKELVGNISHDLKTPLTVMSVNLEQLLDMAEVQADGDLRRHAQIAYHKSRDLQRLTQNLLEVSRIEAGRLVYSLDWLPLSDLAGQMAEKYGDFLAGEGIALTVDPVPDVDIQAERLKIWSVLDNIIYNAVRHTPEGGRVSVTCHTEGASAILRITDTGCGIDEAHLPHIFARFYRVSSARDQKSGESGLGLYIVKSIMEGIGGGVTAESKPGEGTTILLRFAARHR